MGTKGPSYINAPYQRCNGHHKANSGKHGAHTFEVPCIPFPFPRGPLKGVIYTYRIANTSAMSWTKRMLDTQQCKLRDQSAARVLHSPMILQEYFNLSCTKLKPPASGGASSARKAQNARFHAHHWGAMIHRPRACESIYSCTAQIQELITRDYENMNARDLSRLFLACSGYTRFSYRVATLSF